MHDGDALEFAGNTRPLPDSSPSSSALRGYVARWRAPGPPHAASVYGLPVCEEHWSKNPWIPAPRLREDRLRGNDINCIIAVIPAKAGIHAAYPNTNAARRTAPARARA